ncbi:response regulator transcription factor [soil metagenome]
MSSQGIGVVIADSHPLFRLGMRLFLSGQSGYDLIGEAENIDQLMRLMAKRRPELIVVELALIVAEHVEVSRFLQQNLHRERLLIMTDDLTDRLYDHGLVMLCSKHAAPETVLNALKSLSDRPRDPDANDRPAPGQWIHSLSTTTNPLTTRELDIIHLIAEGLSNHQISSRLTISDQTVKNHVTAILRKLDATDRAQAVLICLRSGWIDLDQST